jgi:two-component system NtrC family sensor kinase
MTLIDRLAPRPAAGSWELPAEAIAVKIRWFGLCVGLALADLDAAAVSRLPLNVILGFGLVFTAVDTAAYRAGRVFLRDHPLLVSALEAVYIGLLCLSDTGTNSPFRFYYLLSLTGCAVRYAPRVTFVTCGIDMVGYGLLYLAEPRDERDPSSALLTVVILAWVAWAAAAMARLLRGASENLRTLNAALRENQTLLESRIAERTRDLEESQAQVLHQEKMAAFGLLAAGIAHEVGNPLTAISAVVQLLEGRVADDATRDKLRLITPELARIQAILRELIGFSRPASDQAGRVQLDDVVTEALRIAKFYKGGNNRRVVATLDNALPPLHGVRDQFVQVVFNLVLNAIDATAKGGTIEVRVRRAGNAIALEVADDGCGIPPEVTTRLFRPYFTTKRHGTGLGLFVIRRIAEAHGGAVVVESEVGRGTTFRVTLPVPVAVPPRPAVALT